MKQLINLRQLTLISIIFAAVIYRILPHPFNFTPIIAMALFSGSKFSTQSQALFIPIVAMLLSDFILGFHQTMLFVYGSLALVVLVGVFLKKNQQKNTSKSHSLLKLFMATVFSTGIFFIVTNFGVWFVGDFYPKTAVGLTECYFAAVPFLQNSLIGNLFFSGLIFGGFYLAEKNVEQLKKSYS